jgi:hypothetical protein
MSRRVVAVFTYLQEKKSLFVVRFSHFLHNLVLSDYYLANQFKINLMFTGSRLPLYTYGALQIKLINHDGINETFTLTR